MCLGSDLGHHIGLFISVQDLNFVVLVGQCVMSHIAPQVDGKPSIKDSFNQYPAMCIAQLSRVMFIIIKFRIIDSQVQF